MVGLSLTAINRAGSPSPDFTLDYVGRLRLAKIISLHHMATLCPEKLKLFPTLYAFCNDLDTKTLRHRNNRVHDRRIISICRNISHE